MKAKFFKIAGVKNESEFYKKYPTEAAFFKAHPEAKKLKKAQVGDLLSKSPGEGYNWDPYMNQWVEGGMDYSQTQSKGTPATGVVNVAGQLVGGLTSGSGGGGTFASSAIPNVASKTGGNKPDVLGGIAKGLPLIGDIAGAIGNIGQMKRQRKELEKARKVSDVALQASQTQPEKISRRYAQQQIISPNERFIPGGKRTEILAEYGASIGGNPTEIQNMYNPGDLYSNLGYEPLSESDVVKQYRSGGDVPKANTGFVDFMSGGGGQAISNLMGAGFSQISGGAAAGSQIGGALGSVAGLIPGAGPVAKAIAQPLFQAIGGGIGTILDAKGSAEQKRNERKLKRNIETMTMQDSTRGLLGNYSSFVRNGGDIPYAEHGWVSHDWQPQLITKWGDVNVEDVDDIFRPADMRTLEHGGLLKAQGGMNLPYPNYEERVNRFRNIMGKYSEQELNRRATTEAGLAEYAKLYPNEPFTKEDISFFQDYTTKVLDPQTQAFMQRRGNQDWKPGTQRSGTDAIWGPKTQKQPFATAAIKPAGASEFTELGTVRSGFSTSGTDKGGSVDMKGLVPSKMILPGGKSVGIEFIETSEGKKPYFRNPSTGDIAPYDSSKYHSDTGRYYRTGGNIRQNNLSELDNFNFGGSLKTHWGGRAEVDSYNPYLPGTGETVMFKGNQHSESDGKGNTGIGVSYGESDSYTDYAEYGTEQAVKKAKVEVENREPAIQLPEPSPYSPMQNFASGGQADNNNYSMTVFGALKINEHAANEIGDKQAKGRTFKTYIAEVNEKENEANNKLAKANKQLEELKVVTPFDRLKLNSLQSTIQGENDKLKDYAVKKVTAAEVQNAYNETAEEYGVDADALAKGKIKQSKDMGNAKYGTKKAQDGSVVDYLTKEGMPSDFKSRKKLAEERGIKNYKGTASQNIELLNKLKSSSSSNLNKQPKITDADFVTPELIGTDSKPVEKSQLELLEEQGLGPSNWRKDVNASAAASKLPKKKEGETDWLDFAKIASGQLANLLRRPLQEDLRGDQLYGEMLAKSQNQLQPVQAQTYQPLLDTPFDVSFQDQLNQNQATFNALQRQIGANPAALSTLAAQKYSADKQVLADQFRTNQAMRAGVFSKNRDTLNDAALKNLAILDQQYTRQAEAISKTKATDLEIAKSISDKIAKNRLENRQFAAYSNMFPQYGFNRNMMAVSQAPTFFNTGIVPGLSPEDAKAFQEKYDQKNKEKTQSSTTAKYGKNLKKHFKNGSIVKSLKNI